MAKQCEQNTDQNYVVGRGRLFFDKFKDGCNESEHGEQYFGNTPELSLSSDTETLDHYSSDYGLREKDMTVMLEHSRSGSFTTDNISAENLALFFLGDQAKVTQTQVTAAKEIFSDIKLGRYIQLGASEVLPMGVRNIENLSVYVADADVSINLGEGDIEGTEGVTKVNLVGQIEYDLTQARLYLEPTATEVKDGQQLIAQYDIKAQSRELIIARNRMIYGALRFMSDNPVGDAKDFYWPKVMLQPDGDYALKGDDWQQIGFTFSVLRKNRKVEQVYIESAAARVADPKPEPEEVLTIKVNPSSGIHGTRFVATAKATKGGSPIEAAVSLLVTGQGLVTASGESINKRTDPGTGEATFNLDGVNQTDAATIGKLRVLNEKTQSDEISVTVIPEEKPLTIAVEAKPTSVVDQTGEVTFTATVMRGTTPVQGADVRFISDGQITWQFDKMTYTSDSNGKVTAKAVPTLGDVPAGEFTFTGKASVGGETADSTTVTVAVVPKS
ncbi:major tail protein with Ig-like domain [Providencia phage Kokobel1]|uniref:Major tail protein n=1 Tax=Providencia phage Kokobel1 TaxID=2783540 RepID=A0A873WG24_9CAUD|nr:major tail protein with Ig-like domain [Providencia phage Kokobel1]QPB11452.1 hypothetical protein [Providencia phage Kokobel1]